MDCLLCSATDSNLTDVRGNGEYEEKVKVLLVTQNTDLPRGPLLICLDCIENIYNDENVNPESMPKTQQLSDSLDRLNNVSIISNNSSLTQSQPPSQVPVFLPLGTDPEADMLPADLNDSSFLASFPPKMLVKCKTINLMPAPRAIKRRRMLEQLLQPESDEIASPQEQSLDYINSRKQMADHIKAKMREKQKNSKRRRLESSVNRSTTSSSSSQHSKSIPSSLEVSEREFVAVAVPADPSPRSSQIVQRSPPTDINDDLYRRRQPSSSLSSSEDKLPIVPASTPVFSSKPGPASKKPPATKPAPASKPGPASKKAPTSKPTPAPSFDDSDDSIQLPASVQDSSPTDFATIRRRADDGNAHTNMGAPRRINYVPPPSSTGAQSRDVRVGIKFTSGG